ncbi:MAG: dTDP-glucose 4,6-dehydratase [Chloroflexia bacterium]|nr:dTDP-glucose 4,6-dehydratase [Chloroflexia bacterium]
MRILVTGAAGFIGSAYVRQVLEHHDQDEVLGLDLLTYAGNMANLQGLKANSRFRFVHGDIADREVVEDLVARVDGIVNFAAETHVDRSLLEPEAFARANVTGVMTLLDAARRHGRRLVQVSTDEVYGHVDDGHHSVESDPLRPRSPYSAAKAGGELMCQAFFISHGTDVVVTRGSNTVGPRQYPEKLVPLFVTNALRDLPLPVYGDGLQLRDWLYVDDHAAGVDLVVRQGRAGEAYNIGVGQERPNIEVIRAILDRLDKPESLIVHVPDRPGHDRRYSLNPAKIREELGWSPRRDFASTINDTVDWYVSNPTWWRAIAADDQRFADYYERQYGWRLEAAGAGTRDGS